MFKSTKTHNIFPTPVWSLDLEEETAARLNRQIMVQLDRILTPRPEIPVGATWQTDQRLHTLPAFAELTRCIEKAARGALEFMGIDYNRFEITACWANINPQGSLNSSHTHPNNYLSGVYYVRIPEDSSVIVFEDPRTAAAAILPKIKSYNAYNGNTATFEVAEGRFLLFPAYLRHGVPVNRSPGERVSIAYNIMFSGFTEEMARPLWRGLPLDGSRDGSGDQREES